MDKKIIHLNTSTSGGAFDAAYNIFTQINKLNRWDLEFYSSENSHNINIFAISQPNSFYYRQLFKKYYSLIKLINNKNHFELFSLPKHPFRYKIKEKNLKAVHLHWIDEWFDLKTFFRSIPYEMPIIWTLHDMCPFTGGCHSTLDCNGYQKACSFCPQLSENFNKKRISSKNLKLKKDIYKDRELHIVASSDDMLNRAKSSSVFPHQTKFYKIHLAIDQTKINAINKKLAREALQLPGNSFLLGFAASDLLRPNKGLNMLLDSIKNFKDITLVTFGYPNELNLSIKNAHVHFGFLYNSSLKSLILSSLDVLVNPSIFESFGLITLEGLLHDIPVITSRIGGGATIINHGVNGYLFKNGDSRDLARMIKKVKDNPDELLSSGKGRYQDWISKFSMSNLQNSYLSLYKSIFNEN